MRDIVLIQKCVMIFHLYVHILNGHHLIL